MKQPKCSKRPHYANNQNTNRNECRSVRTEKQKENQRSNEQSRANKQTNFTFHILGVDGSDIRHSRNFQVNSG